jgi:hypothetical protein
VQGKERSEALNNQQFVRRTDRLLPFDTTRTAQKTMRLTTVLLLRVYSSLG